MTHQLKSRGRSQHATAKPAAAAAPRRSEPSRPPLQRKSACACGGGCPRCQGEPERPPLQAKLKVSAPGDQYEQEADRVAEQVMRMTQPAGAVSPHIGLSSASLLRRDSPEGGAGGPPRAVPEAQSQIDGLRGGGGGQPLPRSVRSFFEPRFKRDFGRVRLHTGARAAASARAVNARAYTSGEEIVFGAGEYAPETYEGRKLLAHELTHVVQQSAGEKRIQRMSTADCSRAEEETVREAVSSAYGDLNAVLPMLRQRPLPDAVRNALWLAFRSDSETTNDSVAANLNLVRSRLGDTRYTCRRRPQPDYLRTCREGVAAFVTDGIYLCIPEFYDYSLLLQSQTVIHEAAHYYLGVADTGYFTHACEESSPSRAGLMPDERESGTNRDLPSIRLNNADSYSCFVYFLLHTPRAEMNTRAQTFRGTNLRIEPESEGVEGTVIYTETAVPSDPSFHIVDEVEGRRPRTTRPAMGVFRFRWRFEAGGRVFLLESTSGSQYDAFDYRNLAVFVPSGVRATLGREHIQRGTIICEIELFAPVGGRSEPPLRRQIEVTITEGRDPVGNPL